jgi:hypothetical protein
VEWGKIESHKRFVKQRATKTKNSMAHRTDTAISRGICGGRVRGDVVIRDRRDYLSCSAEQHTVDLDGFIWVRGDR